MGSPNLVFQAAPANTKPIPGALVFGDTGNFAPGFQATVFGEPLYAGHRVSGFKTGAVGVPSIGMRAFSVGAVTKLGSPRRVALTQHQQATAYTTFGAPASRRSYTEFGFLASRFGIASTILSASGIYSTKLSAPSIPLRVSGIAAAATFGSAVGKKAQVASGIASTVLGQGHRVAPIAVGFKAAKVSIPSIPLRATEIAPADAHGVPTGYLVQKALAIHSTAFGMARIRQIAVGIAPPVFGVASSYQWLSAHSSYPATAFGTPTSPRDQICQAISRRVFSSFSWPFAFSVTTLKEHRVAAAPGWSPTTYGTASARYTQIASASGFLPTSFAAPTERQTTKAQAAGFITMSLGTHRPALTQGAQPIVITVLGTPTLRSHFQASSASTRVSLGSPTYTRPDAAHAYGWYTPARIGQPTLYKPAYYKAWQLNLGRRFGQPTARTT